MFISLAGLAVISCIHYIYLLVLITKLQATCIPLYWCWIEKKQSFDLYLGSMFSVLDLPYTLQKNEKKKWDVYMEHLHSIRLDASGISVSSQGWEGKKEEAMIDFLPLSRRALPDSKFNFLARSIDWPRLGVTAWRENSSAGGGQTAPCARARHQAPGQTYWR